MGLLSRVAALVSGSVDLALTRAERAAGLKAPEPAPPRDPLTLAPPPFLDRIQAGLAQPLRDDSAFWEAPSRAFPTRDDAEELIKALVPSSVERIDDGGGPASGPKALLTDPFQLIEVLGWRERPTGISFLARDMIVARTPVFAAAVQVRIGQIARHCRVQEDSHGIGFRVGHRSKKKNLTRAARRMAESIQHAILTTTTGDAGIGRDDFEAFTRRVFYDSLVHDQGTWEVIDSRRGRPYSWHAVDAKTIRLADTDETFFERSGDKKVRTVQLLDGQVIQEFRANELAFMVRNPRSSIQAQGYGTSEIDMILHVIVAMLWAFDYNKRFFSQGSTPKGFINFKGQVPARKLQEFRHFFYRMISGIENAWRTPVMNAEQGVEWVSMQSSNRDMEYSAWMDFLIKLTSAIMLIDPTEFGFKYGNEGDRSLFESANEQKITQSKDKGLKPLLIRYQNEINKMIVQRIDEDFELEFLGLDALTQTEKADLDEKKARTYLTIDEIRESEGLSPLPDGEGAVINSPTWMQFKQAKEAAKMAPAPGADGAPDGGAPGEGGSPFDQAGADGDADGGGSLESLLAKFKTPAGGAQGAPVSKAFDHYEV